MLKVKGEGTEGQSFSEGTGGRVPLLETVFLPADSSSSRRWALLQCEHPLMNGRHTVAARSHVSDTDRWTRSLSRAVRDGSVSSHCRRMTIAVSSTSHQ